MGAMFKSLAFFGRKIFLIGLQAVNIDIKKFLQYTVEQGKQDTVTYT